MTTAAMALFIPLLALLAASAGAGPPAPDDSAPAIVWDERAAEHLLSRAAFGAGGAEIGRALELGLDGLVDELLEADLWTGAPFYTRLRSKKYLQLLPATGDLLDVESMARRMRQDDLTQLREFQAWWVDRMLVGAGPLRERMTLFWHGYLPSSQDDVQNSYEMILQNQFLRRNAFGSFGTLLSGIARDPAMLEYLDNASNKKENPNENFARELLELFTLGEGNYSERDVKEVARAFTGWTDRDGRFVFRKGSHDRGKKTVLGVRERLNGDDVIAILLAQESCARRLAGELIGYLEGVPPSEERLASYAETLLANDYHVGAFLRRLFHDPAFYRDEVVGTRIASPLDFLVGTARRLGIRPPGPLVSIAATLLGQEILRPPSVKGWDGGAAWINAGVVVQRANLAGVLLGEVRLRDLPGSAGSGGSGEGEGDGSMMMAGPENGTLRRLARLDRLRWRPRLNLTARVLEAGIGASDLAVAAFLERELLASELSEESRAELLAAVRHARERAGIAEADLLASPFVSEPILRSAAHVLLSLPEASLH